MIDPNSIKPALRGKSDFFSWQLYRWVKASPHYTEIWRGTWNSFTGLDEKRPTLYIGRMDEGLWMHGRTLRHLCRHGENLESFAYSPAHDTRRWVNVTDEWWAEYRQIGVCAIHNGTAHHWTYGVEIRSCDYCGEVQRRGVQIETVTRKIWLPA